VTTVGFVSSNWSWGEEGRTVRCMGASCYYRGGLAAGCFQAAGLGGWVGERMRSRPDGTLELYGQDHGWHAPDIVWTELIGCTREDLEATRRAVAAGQVVLGDLDDDIWQIPRTNDAYKVWNDKARRLSIPSSSPRAPRSSPPPRTSPTRPSSSAHPST